MDPQNPAPTDPQPLITPAAPPATPATPTAPPAPAPTIMMTGQTGGSAKKAIIIGVAILILAVGGYFGYQFWQQSQISAPPDSAALQPTPTPKSSPLATSLDTQLNSLDQDFNALEQDLASDQGLSDQAGDLSE